MKKIVALVLATCFGGASYLAVSFLVFLNAPSSADTTLKIFEIEKGEAFNPVTNRLYRKGLISQTRYFRYYARFTSVQNRIQVGEYELTASMTPKEILAILVSGKSKQYRVTFPEGINIFEIADLLTDEGLIKNRNIFIQAARDQELIKKLLNQNYLSFEGYLFPDTYNFTKQMGPSEIIEMMVRRFKQAYSEVVSPSDQKRLNRHNVVRMASVIEKETGAPHERPQISSVFHNRLKKRMRLQSDPTIIYGIAVETGQVIKNIKRRHIKEKNEYNTYTISGLPKGPISNPGSESIRAAINPAKTDYLYFVSQNDGTHYFSKTYKEHINAVRRYQLNRKAREGKSWRDLNKKKVN